MPFRCLLFFFLAAACPSLALDGRVVDSHGKPIVGASVSLVDHSGVARTDRNGRFVWTPDPSPPFHVLIVLPAGTYMAPVFVEALPDDGPLVVVVEALVSESVIVAGGAAPNIEAPPGSATTSIPEETIRERHSARLTDVIQNVPGAGSLSDLHASVPSLRGLARGRTLLLLDGARVTTERRAGPSATFLDPFFLAGVEVSRGPGSVAYGSDAFGGVIHARTRRVAPGAPTTVRVRGALGAGLPEATAGVELTHGLDDGGFVVQARYRNFEEYRSPEGTVFNSGATDKGFLGRFAHRVGPGDFSIGWQTNLGRNTGRPDSRGEAFQTSYPEESSNRLTMSYDLDPTAGFTRLGFQGFWGNYRLVTERLTMASVGKLGSESLADVRAKDFSFRGFAVRPLGRARWEVGVDIYGRYGLEALSSLTLFDLDDQILGQGEEVSVENARRLNNAVYTSTEMLLGSRWSLGAGARVDRVTTENEGGFFDDHTTANTALSGYGSIKVELARGLSLTGQLAHGFRDPMLSDRYFRGITGRGFVAGNPNLGPERANQFDASLRYGRGPVRWAVFGYFYRLSDLVERFETRDDFFFFRNRGEADIRGLEAELQAELLNGRYNLEVATHWARGNTRDDDAAIDDIPGVNVKFELRRNLAASRGYAQVRVAVFARDERPGPTEIVTPSFTTVDFGAGWRLSPNVELRGTVRNLFDTTYPVSPDNRAVLAPGINAVIAIVGEF